MEKCKRTHTCGELTAADDGKTVVLNGWVDRKRDHGGVSFINIRDRYGLTQAVLDAGAPDNLAALAAELHNEYCVAIKGHVRKRPQEMVNADMATGTIEVAIQELIILNRCPVLPFQIEQQANAKEELRLTYRYLDLRCDSMQKRIKLRSDVTFAVREWMIGQGFYEIETPTFIRSTPEGARDFLVPSRLYAGKFYALPQSPQLYKQLLMVSGFDKYFQIARCYRDEDSRGDRQPEFTQIDIEMSFVGREDILKMTEGLFNYVFKKCMNIELPLAFERLTYQEAMEFYGSDKPDLRFDMKLQDFSNFAVNSGFEALKKALEDGEAEKQQAALKGITKSGGAVKALVVKGAATYSRKQIEELETHAKIYKAKAMAWIKVSGTESSPVLEGGASKFFASQAKEICGALGASTGDLILIIGDSKRQIANIALGAVRSKLGKDLKLAKPNDFRFVWIVDFPLFEYNEDEQRWQAAHHMFSYPQEAYHNMLESDPGAVKGDLYDLVLNGYELASGSIRIHDPALQKRIFNIVGFSAEDAEKKFGFLTQAFSYGAPPHGGIAPGLDRLIMLMSGEDSIKEVIAFPKDSFAKNPMDACPAEVDQKQLDELHLSVKPIEQNLIEQNLIEQNL
ncbi:MAG: aspartate--tRNA ligase [Termitinemataceae bacterium]|nr:MAG: aspartate--tRNA ligase [Termitinemataceae bacterium]